MDHIIVPFVINNPYTIMLCIGVLKGLAVCTPWAADDKIVQFISGWIPTVTSKNEGSK